MGVLVGEDPLELVVVRLHQPPAQRDKYSIAEQPAPAPHLARLEGRAALTHMC